MELVLPLNHVELDQEEMMYLDGGAQQSFHWWGVRFTMTAAESRNFQHQLSLYIAGAAGFAGVSGALKIAPGVIGGAIAGTVAQWWKLTVENNTTSRGVIFNLTWAGVVWARGR